MNEIEVLAALKVLHNEPDREKAESLAEDAISSFLHALGYEDVAEAWDKVPRL
jgi:hypothetical protein